MNQLFLPSFLLCVILSQLSACDFTEKPKDGPPLASDPRHQNAPRRWQVVPLRKSRFGNPKSYVINHQRYHVLDSAQGYHKRGLASWYGRKFDGQLTSTREPFDMFALTAASTTLPIPVFARVTNLENGRSVVVKVNDRGPFHSKRIIDLSYGAAQALGFANKGTAWVDVRTIVNRSTTPIAAHSTRCYQIAALQSKKGAHQLTAQLSELSHLKVSIEKKNHHNRPLYRVIVGPINSTQLNNQLLPTLHRLSLSSPLAKDRPC